MNSWLKVTVPTPHLPLSPRRPQRLLLPVTQTAKARRAQGSPCSGAQQRGAGWTELGPLCSEVGSSAAAEGWWQSLVEDGRGGERRDSIGMAAPMENRTDRRSQSATILQPRRRVGRDGGSSLPQASCKRGAWGAADAVSFSAADSMGTAEDFPTRTEQHYLCEPRVQNHFSNT